MSRLIAGTWLLSHRWSVKLYALQRERISHGHNRCADGGALLREFSHTRKGGYPQRKEASAQPDRAKLSQQGKENGKKYNFKDSGHTAIARALNLPVSTKQCGNLPLLGSGIFPRRRSSWKKLSLLKRAVPYKRSVMNIAQKDRNVSRQISTERKRDIAPAKISRSQRTGERIGRL